MYCFCIVSKQKCTLYWVSKDGALTTIDGFLAGLRMVFLAAGFKEVSSEVGGRALFDMAKTWRIVDTLKDGMVRSGNVSSRRGLGRAPGIDES